MILRLTWLCLLAGMAAGAQTTPKKVEPWTTCRCAGKPCKPAIDNMIGGTMKACKRAGGEWKPVTATAQLMFTPEQQAAHPANAWMKMKPCGPSNHDDACVIENTHPFEPSELSAANLFTTGNLTLASPDPHGCGWSFVWDEQAQSCAIHVTFSQITGPVSCSPVAPDTDGTQHMICWYKPAVPVPAP